MDVYRSILRPLLFRLSAERAHELAKTALRRARLWSVIAPGPVRDDRLRIDVAGVRLANPVGLAAGFDKNCEMLGTFAALGFGYSIPGSIRGGPTEDNASPKILRYVDRESLINCTGFPSRGAAYSARQLERFRQSAPSTMAVMPNVTGFSIEEYMSGFTSVQPYADAVEISLSCPNERYTEEQNFLDPTTFSRLLDALGRVKQRPIFVKIRNHNDERERENRFRLIELCVEHGVDGIMLPGSYIAKEPRLSLGRGNLSGRAVFPRTLENIRDVRRVSGGRLAIKALGGIFTAHDAFQAISAGASSVELLTGLVYEGWSVARRINEGLVRLLEEHGIASVRDLVGHEAPAEPAAIRT